MNQAHSEPVEPDYSERAEQMNRAAHDEIKRTIAGLMERLKARTENFKDHRTAAETEAVEGVNTAREIGAQLTLFTGHEKLLPADFQSLVPAFGADVKLDFAKSCLALHKKFPAPVETFSVARDEWHHLMVQLDLLPKPVRGPASPLVISEPVLEQITAVGKRAQDAAAFERKTPMEQWSPFLVQSFLKESEPIVALRKKAEELVAK